jgi:two-component system KDP operon response regulator KdpE
VDDERSYRVLLDMNLRRAGYRVLLAETGAEGLDLLVRESPDLVLLDLRLPDLDGEDVCRRIRSGAPYAAHAGVAIIMVTARAEQSQKVRGLVSGADDYVTKPFDMAELLARIQAVLRRSASTSRSAAGSPDASAPAYHHGALVVDPAVPRVALDGVDVACTPEEHRLLATLATSPGRVVLEDELLRRVWGADQQHNTALLHTTLWRLRKKLEPNPGRPLHLLALPGVGYSLAAADA